MTTTDPSTGELLPPEAIQRILYIASKVHVYLPPPLTSTKGFNASTWTAPGTNHQISTCRLRILETALPKRDGTETVKTDILLEDPSSGQLFAAAPYTGPTSDEQALDSSRFFALKVVGEGGRKATLGIGFEERSEAFDFGVSLQEVRKVHGMNGSGAGTGEKRSATAVKEVEKRDFSLKEGETITVNMGGRGRRTKNEGSSPSTMSDNDALFSYKPPPSSSGNSAMPVLTPPTTLDRGSAHLVRNGASVPRKNSAADLGFDDGEFGEFQ